MSWQLGTYQFYVHLYTMKMKPNVKVNVIGCAGTHCLTFYRAALVHVAKFVRATAYNAGGLRFESHPRQLVALAALGTCIHTCCATIMLPHPRVTSLLTVHY